MDVKVLEQLFALSGDDTKCVEMVGKESDYYWLGTLNDHGFRCGYVFTDKDDKVELMQKAADSIDVHGGVTYSWNRLLNWRGVAWCLAFDCAHTNDVPDVEAAKARFREPTNPHLLGIDAAAGAEVRSASFVMEQCLHMIKQLKELENKEK